MDNEIEKRNEIISIDDNLLKVKIKNIGPSIIHFSKNKLNKLNKKFTDNQNLFEWLNVIKFVAAEFGCLDLIYYHYNGVQNDEENKKMNKFLRNIIIETTDVSLYPCYVRYFSIKRILEELIKFFDLNNLELINYDQDISRQGFYNKSIFEINFDHLDLFQIAFQIYKAENYTNDINNNLDNDYNHYDLKLNEKINQQSINYDENNNFISTQQITSNINQIEFDQKKINYLNTINNSPTSYQTSKCIKIADQYTNQISNLSQLCSSPKLNSFLNVYNCFNEIKTITESPIKSLVSPSKNINQQSSTVKFDDQLSSSPLSIYSQPITSIGPDQIYVKPMDILNIQSSAEFNQFNSSLSIFNSNIPSPIKCSSFNSINHSYNTKLAFSNSSDQIFKKPKSIQIPSSSISPISYTTNKKLKNLIKNRIDKK